MKSLLVSRGEVIQRQDLCGREATVWLYNRKVPSLSPGQGNLTKWQVKSLSSRNNLFYFNNFYKNKFCTKHMNTKFIYSIMYIMRGIACKLFKNSGHRYICTILSHKNINHWCFIIYEIRKKLGIRHAAKSLFFRWSRQKIGQSAGSSHAYNVINQRSVVFEEEKRRKHKKNQVERIAVKHSKLRWFGLGHFIFSPGNPLEKINFSKTANQITRFVITKLYKLLSIFTENNRPGA